MWLGSHKCIWETVVGLILASYVMSGQDAPMKSCQSTALLLSTCIFVSIDPLSASHRTLCPDFCQSSLSSLCDKGARRFRPESLCRRPLIAPFRPMDAVQHNRDSVINTCFSIVEAYSLSTLIMRLIWLILMQMQTSETGPWWSDNSK